MNQLARGNNQVIPAKAGSVMSGDIFFS